MFLDVVLQLIKFCSKVLWMSACSSSHSYPSVYDICNNSSVVRIKPRWASIAINFSLCTFYDGTKLLYFKLIPSMLLFTAGQPNQKLFKQLNPLPFLWSARVIDDKKEMYPVWADKAERGGGTDTSSYTTATSCHGDKSILSPSPGNTLEFVT